MSKGWNEARLSFKNKRHERVSKASAFLKLAARGGDRVAAAILDPEVCGGSTSVAVSSGTEIQSPTHIQLAASTTGFQMTGFHDSRCVLCGAIVFNKPYYSSASSGLTLFWKPTGLANQIHDTGGGIPRKEWSARQPPWAAVKGSRRRVSWVARLVRGGLMQRMAHDRIGTRLQAYVAAEDGSSKA